MKRALIDSNNNRVIQVVDAGGDFEVHSALYWVDCPDDTGTFYLYDPDELTFEDPHASGKDSFGNPVEPFAMQRQRAYPSNGDQMDMIWKELQATGTLSTDGEWYQSILTVKNSIPKPPNYDPADPIATTIDQYVDGNGNPVNIYSGINGTTSSDGIGAEFKIRVAGEVTQLAIMLGGSGYAIGDTFTFADGDNYNFTANVDAASDSGEITAISID